MEYRFDPYTRSFSAVYPEYDEYDAYNAYYSAVDEEEAARKARNRKRMRNLAIGAGAAAALAGGGLLYLRHKGHGSIGKGWAKLKYGISNKLSGGKLEEDRKDARKQKQNFERLAGSISKQRNRQRAKAAAAAARAVEIANNMGSGI